MRQELRWIEDHADGKPFGIDVLIPENMATAGETGVTYNSLRSRVSPRHTEFARELLAKAGVTMPERTVDDASKRREKPADRDAKAAARQRARDRAGDEGLPRKSGPPKRGG